jgi:hypothetical protein
MSENLVVKSPVFIEDGGQPVAVLVPIELFHAWQQQLQMQARPDPSTQPKSYGGFEREKAAFERLKPDLLERFPDKCVAIVGGQVVEVGEDKLKVIERVRERFGRVSMYVQWVTAQPRVYHFPHRQVVKA